MFLNCPRAVLSTNSNDNGTKIFMISLNRIRQSADLKQEIVIITLTQLFYTKRVFFSKSLTFSISIYLCSTQTQLEAMLAEQ